MSSDDSIGVQIAEDVVITEQSTKHRSARGERKRFLAEEVASVDHIASAKQAAAVLYDRALAQGLQTTLGSLTVGLHALRKSRRMVTSKKTQDLAFKKSPSNKIAQDFIRDVESRFPSGLSRVERVSRLLAAAREAGYRVTEHDVAKERDALAVPVANRKATEALPPTSRQKRERTPKEADFNVDEVLAPVRKVLSDALVRAERAEKENERLRTVIENIRKELKMAP